MMIETRAKAGQVLMIEYGEYSDKGWYGPLKAKKDFLLREAATSFQEEFKARSEENRDWEEAPQTREFGPWLIARGYVEDFGDLVRWNVGDLSFDPWWQDRDERIFSR